MRLRSRRLPAPGLRDKLDKTQQSLTIAMLVHSTDHLNISCLNKQYTTLQSEEVPDETTGHF